ncbi:MAG: pitrilysin family protein, partial [Acidobacteriota bacterium]
MKNSCMVILLVLLTAVSTTLRGQEGRIFPFEFKKVELNNGFKAYLIQAGAPGQIAYVTVVRSGSRDEYEPGRSGYAHFFEHMMFRGTGRYPEYDAIAGGLGALYNASTSNDFTQYYLVASSNTLEQVIDLESDRFMNLQYTESQFRTEAGAILGEFSQGKSSPYYYLEEKTADTAFNRHTYRHLTVGSETDVRSMPKGYAYSLSFYKRYYRPENCVLLLAGDFDFERAETLIRKSYSSWKPGYRASEVVPEPLQTSSREATVEFPGRTLPFLSVKYKGPAWSAADRVAVATEVLGKVAFGENSDIYRKLVIQDHTVQSFSANFELMRDPGLLGVTTLVTDPDNLPVVEEEIKKTVEKFRRDLADAAVLDDTKSAMKYSYLMSLETALGVCFSLRPIVTFTGGIEAIE